MVTVGDDRHLDDPKHIRTHGKHSDISIISDLPAAGQSNAKGLYTHQLSNYRIFNAI